MNQQRLQRMIADFQEQLLTLAPMEEFGDINQLKAFGKQYLKKELKREINLIKDFRHNLIKLQKEPSQVELLTQYFLLEKQSYLLSLEEILEQRIPMHHIYKKIYHLTEETLQNMNHQLLDVYLYYSMIVPMKKEEKGRPFTGDDVIRLLNVLGFQPNLSGYKYIQYLMIKMIEGDLTPKDRITKTIYPTIALHFKTTDLRVEKAIRSAIDMAWARGNEKIFAEVLSCDDITERKKPTNGEFFMALYNYILLKIWRDGVDDKSMRESADLCTN